MSISTHAKILANLSKTAYNFLFKIQDKLLKYLESTCRMWPVQTQNPLDTFIQIYTNLSYFCYVQKDRKSIINWKSLHFNTEYSHLFIQDKQIPPEIQELLINPIRKHISRWEAPDKTEIEKSSMFYGYYLQYYKPESAKDAGAVYTPREVVEFIVKSISDLSHNHLGVENGLKNSVFPFKIVDPAVGTMNFITGLIHFRDSQTFNLSNKILTMEISEIPFLLGLHMIKSQIDITNPNHFCYGNALTKESFQKINNFLGREKDDISIILGNPPYYINTQNNLPWIREELIEYKKDLQEKNLKILSDDYVKFIRISHKLFQQQNRKGMIALITNNNYLDGAVFKSMRKSLMETFNTIYVVDLHGNFRKNETGNPFKIKVGVCIIFMLKTITNGNNSGDCDIYYWDLPQSNLTDKYRALSEGFLLQNFRKVEITPDFFFIPHDVEKEQQYHKFIPINKLFKENPKSGIMTGRDSLVSNPDKASLNENMVHFFKKRFKKLEDLNIRVKKTKTWDPETALQRSSLTKAQNSIIRYNYRGFIQDYLVYDNNLVDGCRKGYLDKISRNNPAICVTRSIRSSHFSHALVVSTPPEKCFLGVRDSSYVFLLHSSDNQKEYNVVSPNLNYRTSPEKVFSYIYGILYCPTYRTLYEEQLKNHFPRIPFPKTKILFGNMAILGKELIKIHLDESSLPIHEFEIQNKSELLICDYYFDVTTSTLYFDQESTSLSISGISSSMWNFEIGSIKQLDYWLKSHRTYNSIKAKKKRHIGLLRSLLPDELSEFIYLCAKIRSTIEILPRLDPLYEQIIAEIFKQSKN